MRSSAIALLILFSQAGCFVLVPFIEPHNSPETAACPYTGEISRSIKPNAAKPPTKKSSRYVARYIKQLEDPRDTKRSAAASYLGMIGPDAAPAIPALIGRLNDESKFVRRAVVKALGKIGVRSAQVEDALIRASADRDRFVAKSALNALAQLRLDREAPIPAGAPVYIMRSNKRVDG